MLEPQRLGRYFLLRKIATGGMAEIFLAKLLGAAGFEKELVIKKILPQWSSDKDFISMLIDEAKIAVQLTHPNIVQVYELGRERETYYIAMEYLDGIDLRRMMQKVPKRRLPLDLILRIVSEVLDGLAYAHTKSDSQGRPMQIIHRDISPQNLLVGFDGTVKITDFGIAKATSQSHETVTGFLKGKSAYMSPEQARQEVLDPRSDLFSLGVVLYELLTGTRLFHRGSDWDTLEAVRRGEFSIPPEAEKVIPGRLKEILLKALAKDREGRFSDAASFRDEILKFARRSRKVLSRDRLSSFLTSHFACEVVRQTQEETRILSQTTVPLPGATRSVESREVIVRGLPFKTWETSGFSARSRVRVGRWIVSGIGLAAAILLLFFGLRGLQPEEEVLDRPSIWGEEVASRSWLAAPPHLKAGPHRLDLPATSSPPLTEGPSPSPAGLSEQESEESQDEPVLLPPVVMLESTRSEVGKPVAKEGYLSVQAIPWGAVFIDGKKGRETPVRRLPLKVGRHSIGVTHEPSGKRIASQISIASGQEIVCIANFRQGEELRCSR